MVRESSKLLKVSLRIPNNIRDYLADLSRDVVYKGCNFFYHVTRFCVTDNWNFFYTVSIMRFLKNLLEFL